MDVVRKEADRCKGRNKVTSRNGATGQPSFTTGVAEEGDKTVLPISLLFL